MIGSALALFAAKRAAGGVLGFVLTHWKPILILAAVAVAGVYVFKVGYSAGHKVGYSAGYKKGDVAGYQRRIDDVKKADAKATKERELDNVRTENQTDFDACVEYLTSGGLPIGECEQLRGVHP